MVYIKRKTSFSAGGKKQKPFFSDGSFYQIFKPPRGGPPDMQKRRTFHTTPRGVVPKALLQ
jgi:hypothetical protein